MSNTLVAAAPAASTALSWTLSLAAILAAYLLGSLPSAYLAGRAFAGLDIRKVGSGNMGATNVFRTLGAGPGALVLIADMGKGWLAVSLLPSLFHLTPNNWDTLACALAAVLGHSYTCFLGFRGGKGVATSGGVFLGLEPWNTLAALAAFGLTFWGTRMVSAGSLAAALVLPLLIWLLPAWSGPLQRASFWVALTAALLIWVRHIPNIRRILAGTEHRFGAPKRGQGGEGGGDA